MIDDVTLVFDIGKTNKKLFLLDSQFNELHQEYIRFDEITDDDGFPCENLKEITSWILSSMIKWSLSHKYAVKFLNFSTYGASLVHLNEQGNVVCPFYNYLKPFPEDLKEEFFSKYGHEDEFSLTTSSPSMGFLNSGLQLYFLKYKKPEIFDQIHISLHFPQYLSFLITGQYWTDYTSLGCHTGLWDFSKSNYADWVKKEGFLSLLPPIRENSKTISTVFQGNRLEVGIGVHDSSSALVPYCASNDAPFALISTGTWSICLCPFNDEDISKEELRQDCLQFLTPEGTSVKAARLFLGQELRDQAMKIGVHFGISYHDYKDVTFDPDFKPIGKTDSDFFFEYQHLDVERFGFTAVEKEDLSVFESFEQAHHQLMHELTDLQVASLRLALGASEVKDIFIDGGFAHNDLFAKMLANKLPDKRIQSTDFALGSSLGAAILSRGDQLIEHGYFENYQLRLHTALQ